MSLEAVELSKHGSQIARSGGEERVGSDERLPILANPQIQVLDSLLELAEFQALVQLLLPVLPADLDVLVETLGRGRGLENAICGINVRQSETLEQTEKQQRQHTMVWE